MKKIKPRKKSKPPKTIKQDYDIPIISVINLENLMRLKPSEEDTAAYFRVNIKTIQRYIRKHCDLTFVQFRNQNMVHTRLSIVRKAIGMAESGNVPMLIFCLKNLCGWRDKHEVSGDKDAPLMFSATDVIRQSVKDAEAMKKKEKK